MAYTPHVLVAFGGTWTDALSEVWECTVRILADGGGGVTIDPDAYLADVAPQLGTWFSNAPNMMSNNAMLKWVKANHIKADGTYLDPANTHVYDYGTAHQGGTGNAIPGYCSLAYTWETAAARGPGHRGRIYPPNTVLGATAHTFTVTATQRDANAVAGAGVLAALKNTAGANGTKGTPVVASKVNGALVHITGCTSDDVYDVQRRRKNRIKPTRSALVAFA